MSRFLVFSDLHLNAWKYGSSIDTYTGNTRLTGQVKFIEFMADYARQREIRYVLFCGDFFHTPGSIRTEVLKSAWASISNCATDIEFVWLVGNHDQADKAGNVHAMDFLEQFGTLCSSGTVSLPGMPPICGLDYTESVDKLKTFLTSVPKEAIVLLHQGVSGVDINSKGFTLNEILNPAMIPDKITHAFSGHYHSYKRVSDKLTIPGAPMQHNWGDCGDERGFLDVVLEGGKVCIKHVNPKVNSTFRKVHYDIPEEWSGNYKNDFVRVVGAPKGMEAEIKKLLDSSLFVEVESVLDRSTNVTRDKFESLETLVDVFISSLDIKGRRLEVGKGLIAGKYEAPKTSC